MFSKMILVDQFGQNETVSLNSSNPLPVYIPRIGEQVVWKYNPAPKVSGIQYNFSEGVIYVTLG